MNEEVRARRHVRRLRDFYIHLAMYVIVMGGIVLLNWVVSPTFWWAVFPAIGWGIGLAAHGISVLFEDSVFGASWEERKTRELLQHDQRRG
jgi:two-component system, LytTR family, sensor kinase